MPVLQFKLRTNKLFPFQFQLAGWAFLISGLFALFLEPILGAGLLLAAVLILTAYRGISFDGVARSYRVYHSFLGFKSGKKTDYQHMDYIYIHPTRTRQQVNTMVTTGITVRNTEYDAYLKVDGSRRIYLMTHKKKDVLLNKLQPLAELFDLEIVDAPARQ